jgi:hypothetical protein
MVDALRYFIEDTLNWFLHSRAKASLCSNNDITCVKILNNFTASYYDSYQLFNPAIYNSIGFSQGPIIIRVVYRVTILVDVIEENINDVYCKDSVIPGNPGGAPRNLITPKVGDTAGTTDGWIEITRILNINSDSYGWAHPGDYNIRNTQLEIAEYKIGLYGMEINPDVIVISPTELKRTRSNSKSELYHISGIGGSTLEDIIGDSQSMFEYGGNIYRNIGGIVKPLFPLIDTTVNRPSNPNVGEQFFDRTIGKPIWYNGTEWVDAAGATV